MLACEQGLHQLRTLKIAGGTTRFTPKLKARQLTQEQNLRDQEVNV